MSKTYKVVAGIIRNEKGKILMLDHKKTGLWTIPLGKTEFGEKPREALVREMKEEVNIDVTQSYVCEKDNFVFSQGFTTTYVYNIIHYNGEIKNNEPDKHLQIRWITLEEIQELKVTKATELALRFLIDRKAANQRTEEDIELMQRRLAHGHYSR